MHIQTDSDAPKAKSSPAPKAGSAPDQAAAQGPAGPDGSTQELVQMLSPEGRLVGKPDPDLSTDVLIRIYKGMVRTRLIDDRLTKLQRQGRIGFHVGAEGEEATIVASAAAMREQDFLFPCYREVGAALYRGMPLQTYINNMYGNANDIPKGRQMPDHVTCRDVGYVSVTAPIGTQITQAVGFAWASKLKKQDVVTASYFGDGATSSNDFHAAMNFAGVLKAPTLFLLRNNGWAISVPASQQTASETYADKALGYGVKAVRCDGNDAIAVYTCTKQAIARATAGAGATLLEMVTYRMGPHTTSDDPSAYRERAEVQEAELANPFTRVQTYLQDLGAWSDAEQAAFEKEVDSELRQCIAEAEGAPAPSLGSMFEDVYEQMPPHLQEQQAECLAGPRTRKQH